MGKPQAQGKGRSVCDEGIAHCPALLLFFTAELLEKCSISNCLDGKHQNFKKHIAEGKGQCSGIIVDDIEGNIQRDLRHNIDDCQKCKHFLLPVAKEQCNAQL